VCRLGYGSNGLINQHRKIKEKSVKVKVIQLDERYKSFITDEERERVGKIFDALKYHNTYNEDERYHEMYALGLEDGVWFLPAFCCEVITEPMIGNYTNQQNISIINPNEHKQNGILLVEDGSVDIDRLEEDGFYVICYRQDSTPPVFIPPDLIQRRQYEI
jgi:hypothetical protein